MFFPCAQDVFVVRWDGPRFRANNFLETLGISVCFSEAENATIVSFSAVLAACEQGHGLCEHWAKSEALNIKPVILKYTDDIDGAGSQVKLPRLGPWRNHRVLLL